MTDLKTKYYRDMTEEEQAKWIAEWLQEHDEKLEIDRLLKKAYDEGYADGLRQGRTWA